MTELIMQTSAKQPLISVIVPVYNTEKYIRRCIDSIINQTYRNLEIILVDDGSPDNCGAICDEYASKDNRIIVVHQENKGLSDARNAGLDICTGEYIAFVDSDDYIEFKMYETMLSELLESKVDICVCQWQYEFSDGNQVIKTENINAEIYGIKTSAEFAAFWYKGSYENGVVCSSCNKLYRKNVFNGIRFEGKYAEDDRIHNKILCKDYSVKIIQEQLYIYFQNKNSITHKPFTKDNLVFLDVLCERIICFSDDIFINTQTKILYCNMYIEYYYKAQKEKIPMSASNEFNRIIKELIFSNSVTAKFLIRMLLFRISPKIYAKICKIK